MDSSFTREEKRFVLAEILKCSDVGVEHLWQFIKANQIVPNWMNMQVPLGRSLSQCIKVVEQMADAPPELQMLAAGHLGANHGCERLEHTSEDVSDRRDSKSSPPSTSSTSSTSIPVAILPRPTTGHDQSLVPTFPPGHSRPRKRGRPSRADRARGQLYPNLPPHLCSRSLPTAGYRPILPAAPLENGDAIRPSPRLLPPILPEPPEVGREKKRRRADDVAQMQQASSAAAIVANTAPAVSSGAV
ncbi:hypothetical protein E4U42_002664 [Claviceps africana]|uniref:Uncharacterized protein n=1 Tax=Claviceps africana TaxID=83212 RepID=A0A8K0JDX0_9HYPO|nr:hypothetical protein E4U42_002664 [Claviceps africana]